MTHRRLVPRSWLLTLAGIILLGGCGSSDDSSDLTGQNGQTGESDLACPMKLRFQGQEYLGTGELKRDPPVTGRTARGVLVVCDDGNGDSGEESVQVSELADLPMERAMLWNGTLLVRDGDLVPRLTRSWFVAPECASSGRFELRGDWLGVTAPHRPRFDGDLRPPYRSRVHVTDGPPDYSGATIQVHVSDNTNPTLGPTDVKTSLWQGGGITAEITCRGRDFVAIGLTSTPG